MSYVVDFENVSVVGLVLQRFEPYRLPADCMLQ